MIKNILFYLLIITLYNSVVNSFEKENCAFPALYAHLYDTHTKRGDYLKPPPKISYMFLSSYNLVSAGFLGFV